MSRQFLYLVPFKPAMLKKRAAEKSFNHDGVSIAIYAKNSGSSYPCARIESDHQLDPAWITSKLVEYGEVSGNVSQYTFTTEAADLPSRPMRPEETEKLEKDLRNGYTSGDFITIGAMALFCICFLATGIANGNIILLLLSLLFLAAFIFAIIVHKRKKKQAAEMQFHPNDWTAIDCTVCNSWSEDKEETRTEDGKEIRETVTYYYHELASGNLAYSHTYSGRKQIGDPVTIFYNTKENWVK